MTLRIKNIIVPAIAIAIKISNTQQISLPLVACYMSLGILFSSLIVSILKAL
jgi:hypothetical protein